MDLRNKVAWITGGARMGQAVASALSQNGCLIALSYRSSRGSAEAMAEAIRRKGGEVLVFRCDLTRPSDIQSAVRTLSAHYKRLDILVNLSSMYEEASIENSERSAKSWTAHLKTNSESAYHLSIAVSPWMKKAGTGRIIHVSDWTSASGRPRYKNFSAYYVSKAAIKAVTETMALELAPRVLVNAIAPGPMIPPPGMSAAESRAVKKATPLGRWGGAGEIAKAVLFLAQTDFVTGETLRVDGGRHLS